MKTLPNIITLILLAAVTCLWSGCATHFSLFAGKPATSFAKHAEPAPNAVPAAKTLAAVDAHTEEVTLDGLARISAIFAQVRALAKDSKNYVEIDRALTQGAAAVQGVQAEIKAHPSAVVGHTLVKQATQIDADNAPDWRITAALYTLAGLCFALAALVAFARGWLMAVPVVGGFLSDIIGPRILKLLPVIGIGFIIGARAYEWCARHPHIVDAFLVLIAVTLGIAYANTVDAGWFGKAEDWLKSKLPWVKHAEQVLAADAARVEDIAAATARKAWDEIKAEYAKLHHPTPPPASPTV